MVLITAVNLSYFNLRIRLGMVLTSGVDGDLLISVYLRGREGWGSVQEEGGVPLGQADSQALVQMSDLVRLLLPSVPGQG